jgi:hypothetical protein
VYLLASRICNRFFLREILCKVTIYMAFHFESLILCSWSDLSSDPFASVGSFLVQLDEKSLKYMSFVLYSDLYSFKKRRATLSSN